MVWGCGALLIREAVRRWQGGWLSALSLGLALSVAEEFIIQQTSLAPLNWMGVTSANGRAWGVNWFYFLFMLGYESVWIVLIPIQITELIFPAHKDKPWLRVRGLVISSVVFLIGSYIAWFLWIKNARPNVFHMPDYHPAPVTIILGLLAIVALIFAGYALRTVRSIEPNPARSAPRPWLVFIASLVMVFPWYFMMALLFIPKEIPLLPPMIAELAWAIVVIYLIKRWATATGWNNMHRWSLTFGALIFCMVAGFLGSNLWLRIDLIGKMILNGLAFLGMIALAMQIRKRAAA
jgi:hypothetical protein